MLARRRVSLIIYILVVIMIVSGSTLAEEESLPQEAVSKLKISYQAQRKFSPEVAVISLAVETREQKLTAAYEDNSRLAQQVKNKLQAMAGVEIISADYKVELEQPPKEKKATNYVVQNQIKIRATNVEKLGRIIEAAMQAGANRVRGINYKLANYDRAVQQVTAQALQGLQEKAEFIAQKMELKVGKVLELQVRENNNYQQTMMPELREGQMKTTASSSRQPIIAPKKIKVEVTARGVYQLK